MSADWWAPGIKATLSQGDVVLQIPLGISVVPAEFLQRSTFSGGVSGWTSKTHRVGVSDHMLAKGKLIDAIVVSHSCDLDKEREKGRVLVAPILPISGLRDDVRRRVLAQETVNLLALPDLPTLGTSYANLRLIGVVDRELVDAASRVASLSDNGLVRLKAQLIYFFTRIPPDAVVIPVEEDE